MVTTPEEEPMGKLKVRREARMKVFIGWSGTRSKALAQAVHGWLPLVLHYVEPFVSETDIAAGERWGQTIGKELEASNFGIISITRENLNSPWIFFESGSLAKSLEEGKVVPLLLDVEFADVSGPLTQFQSKKADRAGMMDIIRSIQGACDSAIDEARVNQLFEMAWPTLDGKVSGIPPADTQTQTTRPQGEILEELVSGVRSLDARMREVEELASRGSASGTSRRREQLDQRIVRDLALNRTDSRDPIILLVTATAFREGVPWLYELGIEAYREAKFGPSPEADRSIATFLRALESVAEASNRRRIGISPGELRNFLVMVRELMPGGLEPSDKTESRSRRDRVEELADHGEEDEPGE